MGDCKTAPGLHGVPHRVAKIQKSAVPPVKFVLRDDFRLDSDTLRDHLLEMAVKASVAVKHSEEHLVPYDAVFDRLGHAVEEDAFWKR